MTKTFIRLLRHLRSFLNMKSGEMRLEERCVLQNILNEVENYFTNLSLLREKEKTYTIVNHF